MIQPPKIAIRSVVAVVAGCLAMLLLEMLIYLTLGIFFPKAFPSIGALPSIPWAIFILIWSLVSAGVGAYVTSLICDGKRVGHVLAMMGIVLLLGLLFLAGNIYKQPTWYLVSKIVVWIVGAMIGGSVPVRSKTQIHHR